MRVKLKIAPQYVEPEIHVCTASEDEKAKELLASVENLFDGSIFAYKHTKRGGNDDF